MTFLTPWKWFWRVAESATDSEHHHSSSSSSSACCGGLFTTLIQYTIILLVIGVPLIYMLGRIFPVVNYYAHVILYNIQLVGSSVFVVLLWPFMYDKEDNNFLPRWCFIELLGAKRCLGLDIQIRGKEILNRLEGPAVIVCNHQSSMDLIATLETVPKRTGIMAKKELLYVGTFGIAVKMCNGILIDRLNRERARSVMQKLADKMQSENLKVWMFPEGTRNRQEGILPFKKGAFHLAMQAHVPIVPIVISSYASFYQRERKVLRPGTIIVSILPPISSDKYTPETVEQFADAARDNMAKEFVRISAEVAAINNSRYAASTTNEQVLAQ